MVSDDPESFADLDGHCYYGNKPECGAREGNGTMEEKAHRICDEDAPCPHEQKDTHGGRGSLSDAFRAKLRKILRGSGKELKNESRDSYIMLGMMGDPISLLIGLSMDEETASDPTEKTAMTATSVALLFVPGGGEGSAAAKGDVFVYRIVDDLGKTAYIGITNNLKRRAAEHGVGELSKIAEGLTREQARGLEQALLVRARELGIPLTNKINSIARSSKIYDEAVAFGRAFIAGRGFTF